MNKEAKNAIEQLMVADDGSITVEQREFKKLHTDILYCGNMATEFAIHMARKLKEMRDKKLYSAAGFETFGEYTQTIGMKERQAYNYITVIENLDEKFLQSNAKIGVTKLALLARLSSGERKEISDNESYEDISVRELRTRIEELETEKAELQTKLDISDVQSEDKINAEKLNIEKLEKEKRDIIKQRDKAILERDKTEKELENLKNTPAKVEKIEDPETVEALKRKERELQDKEEKIIILQKQIEIANDQIMTRFKYLFEDWQKKSAEMFDCLSQLDQDKQSKCRAAIKSVAGGWKL